MPEKSKSFVFTWNAQDDERYAANVAVCSKVKHKLGYKRFICAHEVGESGNKHIQGGIIFKNSHSFNYVRSLFPDAHVERMAGDWTDTVDYCTKEGNIFIHEVRLEWYQVPGCARCHNIIDDFVFWRTV